MGRAYPPPIAPAEAVERQPEAAELISIQRIDAGLEEDDVGPRQVERSRQVALEARNIFRILTTIEKLDVEGRALLVEGKIIRAVHGEGEHGRIVREDRGGAVALVDVEVDHQRALDQPFALQSARGHRDVVEDAESGAAVRERMVRPAREVAGDTVVERGACCQHRPEDAGARSGEERCAPGESQPALRVGGECSGEISIVDQLDGRTAASRIRCSAGELAEDDYARRARARRCAVLSRHAARRKRDHHGNLCPGGSGTSYVSQKNARTAGD